MPLATLIRMKKDEILLDWEEIVRSLEAARRLPHPALRDHMPSLIDWIIRRVEAGDTNGADFPAEKALEHTLERVRAGYDMAEVISEYTALRDCLHDAWERSERDRVSVAEVRRMNQAIDEAITFTAVSYARTRLFPQSSPHPVSSAPVH